MKNQQKEKNVNKHGVNKRRLKYGANNVVLIIASIVIFVLVNFLAEALSEKFPAARFDLKGNGVFEIGNTTKSVLADLDRSGGKINLYYIQNSGDENEYVKEVVLKYLAGSKNLEYEVKNINKDPAFAKKFSDTGTIQENSIVVENAKNSRYRIINPEDMIVYDESGSPSAADLESLLTNAIAYCLSDEDTVVCFVTDHGEVDPSEMGSVLTDENISPTTLSLKTGEVPDACKMLYIISPMDDFTADEIDHLDNYLERGGCVQLAVEPFFTLPRLESYLAEWGVTLGNDIVVENDPNYKVQKRNENELDIFYPQVEHIDINGDLLENGNGRPVFSTLCRSVSFEQDMLGVINCERALRTTRYGSGISFSDDENEEPQTQTGTYALALYLEKPVGENYDKTAKLLVAGSSSFWGASNYAEAIGLDLSGILSEGSLGNNRFFVGSTYEMIGINSTRLTISSKSLRYSRLAMTATQQTLYRIIFCYALPIIIILAGLIIWLRRRHL